MPHVYLPHTAEASTGAHWPSSGRTETPLSSILGGDLPRAPPPLHCRLYAQSMGGVRLMPPTNRGCLPTLYAEEASCILYPLNTEGGSANRHR